MKPMKMKLDVEKKLYLPDDKEAGPKYEQVWSMQEAINKAVAENRPVRFLTRKTNADLKKEITDKKGCQILKPDRFSNEVAVVPPSIKNFDFEDVDSAIVLRGR